MSSPRDTLRSDLLLLMASAIWGFAFVAQRMGMEYVGPFLYNGARFALGAIVLLPVMALRKTHRPVEETPASLLQDGLLLGVVLFAGANLQQVGLLYTTAGKAGFITGLYVIFVPIIGFLFSQRPALGTWLGGLLAVVGLYLLSGRQGLPLDRGDSLVLSCAVVFALHVLLIGKLARYHDPIRLAAMQFAVCAALSLAVAFAIEPVRLGAILDAAIPILYGGAFSAGIAYTLQVLAQRRAPAAHAAIILSLESVFAVLGGWLLLNEVLGPWEMLGCALMLGGMLLSQLLGLRKTK